MRFPGATCAVSKTGPLISAFQSDSFALLTHILAEIHVPTGCVAELSNHGWEEEVRQASPKLVVVQLTPGEERRARNLARQIAQQPEANDMVAEHHLGEAQAIALALRPEHQNDLLLLDELAARAIAKQLRAKISGFPGVLLLAVQGGLISPEELRARLEDCREYGTHYARPFIRQVYEMAKRGRENR